MFRQIGTLREIWRYPVKSMVGERIASARALTSGIVGDRYWALRDEMKEELTVVRKTPGLLRFRAELVDCPSRGVLARITLPDGSSVDSSDPDIHARISDALGHPMTLWPRQPASNWRHYRQSGQVNARELKRLFASAETPDLSSLSWRYLLELMVFTTPLGRYHDVYPLHVLTTRSLARLRELEPEGDFTVERFRPNLVIDTSPASSSRSSSPQASDPRALDTVNFPEFGWVGGTLRIGDTEIRCESPTVRCSMPAQPQVGKPKDPRVVRAIAAHTRRYLGINASLGREGELREGEPVFWKPARAQTLRRPFQQLETRTKRVLVQRGLELLDRVSSNR